MPHESNGCLADWHLELGNNSECRVKWINMTDNNDLQIWFSFFA